MRGSLVVGRMPMLTSGSAAARCTRVRLGSTPLDLFTDTASVASEDDGLHAFVLVHQCRVLEVGDQRSFALDARIVDVAHFFRVEILPFLLLEFQTKFRQVR